MGEDEVKLSSAIDCLGEYIVVTDRQGKITMMSESFRNFLGGDNYIGCNASKVLPGTKLDIVAKKGIEEPIQILSINNHMAVFNSKPIEAKGKIQGAVGKIIFLDTDNLKSISYQISELERKSQLTRNNINAKLQNYDEIFDRIVGKSDKIVQVLEFAKRVSKGESSILITGDSGTGKELMAEAIHNASRRRGKPFVKINCGAIPPELFESEMFGYDEGAFTGARKSGMKGKFEVANGGTILLDEIGDMPLFMQVKLLRVLQEREIMHVGSNEVKKIDVRIIASTNKNLVDLIEEGKFREDLFYRLNVLHIDIPPLRDRVEDIEEIADSLRIKICNKYNMVCDGIDEEAMDYLKSYPWPGNVRELENVIERAINLLNEGFTITKTQLPDTIINCEVKNTSYKKCLKEAVEDAEKSVIKNMLEYTKGNKNKTAQMLGISRQGLYKKLKSLGLE